MISSYDSSLYGSLYISLIYFYVLSGVGTMEYEDTKEKLYPGDCHYCPQGGTHSLSNEGTEDLIFFAVVPEHEH